MARPIKLRRRVDMRNLDVPADVVAVEKAMETVGYYEPPVFGTGRSALWDLDNAIRQLQTDRGLKSDGVIEPGGSTAKHINALLAGRRRPDNPSADTQIAEARRERARGAAPPEAGRPLRPVPSFLKRHTPTLLDGAMRELSGGAEAPARQRPPAGRGGTMPPRKPGGGEMADTFRRMVPPTVPDPTRAEFDKMARETPEEKQRAFLESSDAEFHRFAKDWRKAGHEWAPLFMEQYLEGTGHPVELTRKQARALSLIRDAEATNRERVEQSFVERTSPSGEPNVFHKSILPLIAGDAEQTNIEADNWQVALKVGWRDLEFYDSQKDFGRAFGSLGVNAEVTGRARRVGDLIHVEGAVEHWLYDLYDFEGVFIYGNKAAALEQAGRARRFEIGAGWKQRFTAVIEIVDGEPRIKEFRWMDTNETVNWRANEKARKDRSIKQEQRSRKQAKAKGGEHEAE